MTSLIRVLLVEDDEDDAVITRALLDEAEATEFSLEWVAGWEAGRDAILAGRHDVYLLDYRLGGQSGVDLLREVKARGAAGPFILLTGQGSREVDVEAMAAGASSYLAKRMLDAPILERTIRYAVELRRAEEARRTAEEHARHGERLADLGAVTARIVHDLGNPLAGIAMQIDLLRRKAAVEPSPPLSGATRVLDQLAADVARLTALVREFLDFSREQRLSRRALGIGDLLDDVVRAWQPSAAARGIALECAVEPGLPAVLVDVEKMRRVFDNLVKNALEAIEGSAGTVSIRAAADGEDRVRIEVEDSGHGIPAGIDPFKLFQTSKPEGTGLGLPIVREIVDAHGGAVAIEPGAGGGACVRILLPVGGA
jgi:signal transduction histidine kinase